MKSRRVPPPAFLVHDPEKCALQRALEQAARPAVRLVRVFRVLLMSAPDKFWNRNLKENYHERTGRGATIAIGALFARGLWTSQQCGRAYTFIAAIVIVLVWGAGGPVFGYSDTWQLIINAGTTIIIFLMVFLIQNTGSVSV
jgi:hypothetical protein